MNTNPQQGALRSRWTLEGRIPLAGVAENAEWRRARSVATGEPVVLFIIRGEAAAEAADAVRRAYLVEDPHLLPVQDIVVLDDEEHGEGATTVVEYPMPPAPPLAALLAKGPLHPETARAVIGEAARGLEAARRRGVRHQFVDSNRVFVDTASGEVVVLGVGVEAAAHPGLDRSRETASFQDTAALVALLHRALTGRAPRPGADGEVPRPSTLVEHEIPRDLDLLCDLVLNESAEDIPETTRELIEALEPWQSIPVTLEAYGDPSGSAPRAPVVVPGRSERMSPSSAAAAQPSAASADVAAQDEDAAGAASREPADRTEHGGAGSAAGAGALGAAAVAAGGVGAAAAASQAAGPTLGATDPAEAGSTPTPVPAGDPADGDLEPEPAEGAAPSPAPEDGTRDEDPQNQPSASGAADEADRTSSADDGSADEGSADGAQTPSASDDDGSGAGGAAAAGGAAVLTAGALGAAAGRAGADPSRPEGSAAEQPAAPNPAAGPSAPASEDRLQEEQRRSEAEAAAASRSAGALVTELQLTQKRSASPFPGHLDLAAQQPRRPEGEPAAADAPGSQGDEPSQDGTAEAGPGAAGAAGAAAVGGAAALGGAAAAATLAPSGSTVPSSPGAASDQSATPQTAGDEAELTQPLAVHEDGPIVVRGRDRSVLEESTAQDGSVSSRPSLLREVVGVAVDADDPNTFTLGPQDREERSMQATWIVIGGILLVVGALVLAITTVTRDLPGALSDPLATASEASEEPTAKDSGEAPVEPTAEDTGEPELPAPQLAGVELFAGGDGEPDNADQTERITDGDPQSFWSTKYYSSPDFGSLRDGMGVRLNFAEPSRLSSVTVTTARNTGGVLELRALNDDGSLGDVLATGQFVGDGEVRLDVPEPIDADKVALWIPELPPDSAEAGKFRARIAEVRVE